MGVHRRVPGMGIHGMGVQRMGGPEYLGMDGGHRFGVEVVELDRVALGVDPVEAALGDVEAETARRVQLRLLLQ